MRFLTVSTVGLALGLAVFIGLSAAVPAHAQEDPAECEGISFGPEIIITTNAIGNRLLIAADFDGDGDTDVLSAFDEYSPGVSKSKVAWYENADGQGTFGPQRIIAATANVLRSVFAADLDGDGDTDVLSASSEDDKIAWYENTDGLGTFGPQRVITTNADGVRSVFATDLDGDGDADVLAGSYFDNEIAWYENTDGLGTFGPQRVITTSVDHVRSVFTADLDGDGDPDVLAGAPFENMIAWYENTDGLGTFGPEQIIAVDAHRASPIFTKDLDGDGDIDVLAASKNDYLIVWYENTDGFGTFGPQQVISTADVSYFFPSDLDGDGDIDVLATSWREDRIIWHENTDGRGTFGPQRIVTTSEGPLIVMAVDVDCDGDTDVVSSFSDSGKIAWYENAPDCNGNGVDDGCDLEHGTSLDCNSNGQPDECDIADGISGDCNASDVPDECEPFGIEDVDGDGVVELCDLCPDSQMDRTLILNGCDTNVPEMVFDDGCTMADLLDECNGDTRNHGDYVSCVAYVAREWKHDGVITGREFGRIVSCAAKPRTISRRAFRKVDDGHK